MGACFARLTSWGTAVSHRVDLFGSGEILPCLTGIAGLSQNVHMLEDGA